MNELSLVSSEELVSTEPLPEVITSAPVDVQELIFKLCVSIDEEQHKIRSAAVEIGRSLFTIRETINEQCRIAKIKAKENGESAIGITATPIFEAFINSRFRKGVNWANRMIVIFRHFKADDPLLEVCTTYHLMAVKTLEDKNIDTSSIRARLIAGEKLTIEEINKIENAITNQSENVSVVQETSDQLIQLQTKIERAEKELERNKSEQKKLQDEIDAKANTNENLILQLREKQQAETNNSLESQRQLDALRLQLKNMEEDLKKAKQATTPVEVPTVPKGYSSIEDAIQQKQEELARISEELANSKETFLKKEAASRLFGELHESCSSISLKVLETLNKTSKNDIEENKQVISKIVHMLNTTHNTLSQIA